jgi:hypothetical protein
MERSQNSLSLPYYVFFLILYQSQSADLRQSESEYVSKVLPRVH